LKALGRKVGEAAIEGSLASVTHYLPWRQVL